MAAQGPSSEILTIPRAGYDLHAERIPPRSHAAPWVVFGNSLVTDLTIWDAQISKLAGSYGLLRYDQAGHGRSGIPADKQDFDDLGRDLLAVMDAGGVRRAIYVGLSMGVPTGLAAYKVAADRFSALVFSDGQAKTAQGGGAAWKERIENARVAGMDAFAADTVERWLTKSAGPERRARLTAMIASTPFKAFEICATALQDYDYAAELARIDCPTLLIAGAEDGAMPESMATKLQPAITGSELQIIPGAGHVPCFEQPEAFSSILLQFLEASCGRGTK